MAHSNTADRIMSVSAIVAAIAAVLVAAYEARINREYPIRPLADVSPASMTVRG